MPQNLWKTWSTWMTGLRINNVLYFSNILMKTRIKMYFGTTPYRTASKLLPLYKLQVKRWLLLPRKTIARWITKQEAIEMQQLILHGEEIPQEVQEEQKKKRVVINWSVQKKFLMNQDYIIRKCVMEWMRHSDMAKQLWVSQPQLSKCIRKRKDAQAKKALPEQSKILFW